MLDAGELTLNSTFLSVLFCFVSPPLHPPVLKTQGEAIHLRAEVKLLLGSEPEKGKVAPLGLETYICLAFGKVAVTRGTQGRYRERMG